VPYLITVGISLTIIDIWSLRNIHWYLEIVGQVLAGTVVVGAALAVHAWLDTPPEHAERTSPGTLLRQDRRSSYAAAAIAGVAFSAVAYPALMIAATVASVVSGALMDWPGWPGEQELGSIAAARRTDATNGRFATTWLLVGFAFVLPGVIFTTLVFLTRAWPRFMITRVVLAARGRLPLRLPAFLEDAQQRQLLRQIGGLYQFRHARLQEHLANRPPTDGSEARPHRLAGVKVTRRRIAFAAATLLAASTIPLLRAPHDTSTFTLPGTYDPHANIQFELSPDGSTIATFTTNGDDHRIILWDLNTGKRRMELIGLRGPVDSESGDPHSIQFAAEGRTLVAQSGHGEESTDTSDDALFLWDVNTGRVLRLLKLISNSRYLIARSSLPLSTTSPSYGRPLTAGYLERSKRDRLVMSRSTV
jgi:hypothetical protein